MAVNLDMQVLVVDDHKDMIALARYALRQIGFRNVDDAPDGSKAVKMLESKTYGLVISDLNMQPMTGLTLLKIVRNDPRLAKTPFIMMTAENKVEAVMEAKQHGVSQYLVKPFNVQTMKQKLQLVLGDF